jgi:hypothetical protein
METELHDAQETEEADAGEPDGGQADDVDELDDEPASELGDEGERQASQTAAQEAEADIANAMRLLGKEADRHAKRVGELMGEDANALVVCELCDPRIPGFRFPLVPDEETRERVKLAIGMADLSRLKPDGYSRQCDACEGEGRVRTFSHVNGQDAVKCLRCKGRGWIPVGPEREAGGPQAAAEVLPAGDNTPVEGLPDLDQFGTPAGHPDYGKLPQYREFPLPTQQPMEA